MASPVPFETKSTADHGPPGATVPTPREISVARKQAFKQADVARALKGAKSAGLIVGRVEIEDGKIVLIAGVPAPEPTSDFDAWKVKRNARKA